MPFDSFFGSKNLSPAAKKAAEAALCGRFDFFLSETNGSDKRAFAFFEALSPAETVFAEYAAAFPELFGSAVCDAARKFFLLPRENDPSLATEELPDGIGAAHIGLLKELYAVARRLDKKNKNTEASSFVENYERFASSVFDLRFEGAALERLKDAFYEDERLQIASPDWMKTKENRLVLEPLPPLRPLFRAGEKTARTLADILTLCIFRDGAFPVFDPNEWFLTENGEIFLKKCSRFIVLSLTERRFLNGFIAAFEKENFLEAAKLLFKNKTLPPYFPMSELTKSLESIREALENKRTIAYFGNHLAGDRDLLARFFWAAVSVEVLSEDDAAATFRLDNRYDIPFYLHYGKTRVALLPNHSVDIRLKKADGALNIELENVIVDEASTLNVELKF